MKFIEIFIGLLLASIILCSCENQNVDFPDFDYQTVYFASQYPIRVVELGEDLYVDNSSDNEHVVSIKATTGGVRENTNKIKIGIQVDESLLDGIWGTSYSGNLPSTKLLLMPSTHYSLMSDNITIEKGNILGGVEVKLTDAFFADPLSIGNNYVIPLRIKDVIGADSILSGNPLVANPNRNIAANWITPPKDFILYMVKYVNPWHANYLRRGVDQLTYVATSTVTSNVRHTQYVEKNEVVMATTTNLSTCTLPLSIKNASGVSMPYTLVLTFASDGTCTVSGNNANLEISGTGKFVSKGEKYSMGGIDRDGLYLDYLVKFKSTNIELSTKDTLVVRDRAVKPEYYTVVKK